MAFFDYTDVFGQLLSGLNSISGSLFISLLMLTLFLLSLCLAFNLPVEVSIVLVFPVMLSAALVTQQFITVAGVGMIYIAILMARRFFAN